MYIFILTDNRTVDIYVEFLGKSLIFGSLIGVWEKYQEIL